MKRSRTTLFFYNTVSTALLHIVTMGTGFVLPKVMLNVFGSEINGLVSSIHQFILYISLVEAGLSGATVYSLYKPLAENDIHSVNRVITAAKNFYFKTGYLFLALVTVGALCYPLFVKSALLSKIEIAALFVIMGANGILDFFTLAKYRSLLTADQKTYVISLATTLQVVVNCVLIAVLSYGGMSIVMVRFIAISAILLRALILWLYCRKNYPYMDFSVEPDNSAMDKRWGALYFQVIGVIHTGAPVIIATVVRSLNEVSIYTIYRIVVQGINSVLTIFTTGISAGFGNVLAKNEKENFERAFRQFEYMFYMLVTIAYSAMLATYMPFIHIYTRNADISYDFPMLALLLTVNGYFYSLKTPFGMLTIAAGKYDESAKPISIQAAIEVVGGVLLGIKWGLNGIVVGALLSNIYRDLEFLSFAPKYLIEFSIKGTVVMWLRSILLSALCVFVCRYIPSEQVTGYGSWCIYALEVIAACTALVVLFNALIDRHSMKACVTRLSAMARRKRNAA